MKASSGRAMMWTPDMQVATKGDHLREGDDPSPRSCCSDSDALSCTATTAVVSDGAWTCSPDTSDDEGEAPPSEEVSAAVRALLEGMNAASEEVNELQKALASYQENRLALVRLWAIASARLVRVVDTDRLAQARSCQNRQRRCRSAEDAVRVASDRYSQAVEAGGSDAELAKLAEAHSRAVGGYKTALAEVAEARRRMGSGPGTDSAVAYLEAEAEHQRSLAAVDASVTRATRQLADAKRRYRQALAGLEALSDQIRQERAAAAGLR